MKLKYQTGVATLVQFVVMTVLNFVNGTYSSVKECTTQGGDCLGNLLSSMLLFMVLTAWFAFIWIVGYAAQDRRSKRLAQLLLVTEAIVCLVSLFDARHYPNALGLITSLIDAGIAVWVILLAFRLMKADGGRVRTTPHRRVRN